MIEITKHIPVNQINSDKVFHFLNRDKNLYHQQEHFSCLMVTFATK